MLNGKVIIIHLIAALMKRHSVILYVWKMSHFFPYPYKPFGRNINVKVDLTTLTLYN